MSFTFIFSFAFVDICIGILLRDPQDAVDGVGRTIKDVVMPHTRLGHAGSGGRNGLADWTRGSADDGAARTAATALCPLGSLVANNSEKKVQSLF